MKYVGIDGCKIGWFFVSLEENRNWTIGVLTNISEISVFLSECKTVLIDIPIGLKAGGDLERLCDLSARKTLSLRKSSVFPTPTRQAINCISYEEACKVNYEHSGRRLSRQSWGISEKIKQVDDFLTQVNTLGKIREFHPEIGFWSLNNNVEMQYSKKTKEGFNERLKILSKHFSYAKDVFNESRTKYKTKDVANDDILDALAGAVLIKCSSSLRTLPEKPEIDLIGLTMEIVY